VTAISRVAIVVVVAAVLVACGRDRPTERTGGAASGSVASAHSTVEASTTSNAPESTSTFEETTTTVDGPRETTEPLSGTTSTLACRDSFDPACGDFYWDPAPGPNQPMTMTISYSPAQPVAGQPVTITYTADDPDGVVGECWRRIDTGLHGSGCQASCAQAQTRYGPWTPPPPEAGHGEKVLTETYEAGTYTLAAEYVPVCPTAYDLYQSDASQETQLVVAPY
jgi:hypothetical protein